MKKIIKIGVMTVINIGLVLFCYVLLWNDLHSLSFNTYIGILVKVIIFVIGFILMNKKFKKNKLVTGTCLAVVIIVVGSIIGNGVSDALPTPHSNSDWFSDGVN